MFSQSRLKKFLETLLWVFTDMFCQLFLKGIFMFLNVLGWTDIKASHSDWLKSVNLGSPEWLLLHWNNEFSKCLKDYLVHDSQALNFLLSLHRIVGKSTVLGKHLVHLDFNDFFDLDCWTESKVFKSRTSWSFLRIALFLTSFEIKEGTWIFVNTMKLAACCWHTIFASKILNTLNSFDQYYRQE